MYEGGTLHKSTLREWSQALYPNRLATSADFVAKIEPAGRPVEEYKLAHLAITSDEFKGLAIELASCTSTVAGNGSNAHLNVTDTAATCYVLIKNPALYE